MPFCFRRETRNRWPRRFDQWQPSPRCGPEWRNKAWNWCALNTIGNNLDGRWLRYSRISYTDECEFLRRLAGWPARCFLPGNHEYRVVDIDPKDLVHSQARIIENIGFHTRESGRDIIRIQGIHHDGKSCGLNQAAQDRRCEVRKMDLGDTAIQGQTREAQQAATAFLRYLRK